MSIIQKIFVLYFFIMINMELERALKNNRIFRAITWVTPEEFKRLLPIFTEILIETALKQKNRQRAYWWWRKWNIKEASKKLFFILVYLKIYPTYDLLAYMFDSSRTRVFDRVKNFLPILEKTLWRTLSLPARQISTPEEFYKLFPWVKEIMIDWVERPMIRKKNPKNQTKNYSWKKKWPRRKNTIIADKNKKILYLSPTKNWKLHDKKQIDKTVILPVIPKEVEIFADSWYQWIQHIHPNTYIPKKNTKKKPLSDEDKENNRLISSIRIVVENAICWMKRFKASNDIFRWKKWQDDKLNLISAWLWNFHLQW